MKKIFFVLVSFFTLMTVSAQSTFSKGDKVLNLGIGLGDGLHGTGYSMSLPPLSASIETGVVDGLIDGNASIGLGGYLAYAQYSWNYQTYKQTLSDVILGVRGSFHYEFTKKLDTYAGLMLGYDIVSWKDSDSKSSGSVGSGLILPFHIGARYYISDNIGLMGEIGYGISLLNLGASFKF